MNFKEKNKRLKYSNPRWQKSVAQLLEEMGKKFIPNEKLDSNHPKMKNPNNYKK